MCNLLQHCKLMHDHPPTNPAAANLCQLRFNKGVTVEALAALSGVSARTIWYIEAGSANPRLDIIEKLADALGVPVIELLEA